MPPKLTELKFEIEIQPSAELVFPKDLTKMVGPGRWLVSITSANQTRSSPPLRDHAGFLDSYAIDDEGLYDDYPVA